MDQDRPAAARTGPALTGAADAKPAASAETAARRAGVVVRPLTTLAELSRVKALFDDIWRPGTAGSLVVVELLRAMSHAGNYLAGAEDRSGTLVGASLGFFTAPPGVGLHSHITGVSGRVQRRGVGLALKLHQRAWALARGLTEITWTFDPLVRRNAHFNLLKLGARPREYLVDFYGEIEDSVNQGQGSDRLLAVWQLTDPVPARAVPASAVVARAVPLLEVSPTGEPDGSAAAARPRPGTIGLVRVPADIEAMRAADPELTRRWRRAVRDRLGGAMAAGGRVTGFTADGAYIVEMEGR